MQRVITLALGAVLAFLLSSSVGCIQIRAGDPVVVNGMVARQPRYVRAEQLNIELGYHDLWLEQVNRGELFLIKNKRGKFGGYLQIGTYGANRLPEYAMVISMTEGKYNGRNVFTYYSGAQKTVKKVE